MRTVDSQEHLSMRCVAIVGCGYLGVRLARRFRDLQHPVRGFATRPQSLKDIAAAGAEAVHLDLDRSDSDRIEGGSAPPPLDFSGTLLYYLVPPDRDGARDRRLDGFLAQIKGPVERFIYMSTTGVYGDRAGAAVDEDTPPAPQTERAVRRLAAENALREWADARGVSWCILRVPGIYGPGRLPLERLRLREPAIAPEEATPGNRIHVEDLASACIAAACAARADRRIYNITDGSDESLTAYLMRVARICKLPEPPLISRAEARARFSASSWSFLGESRRVDNRRMREELGVALAYEDLDAGIRASL
jgi:nucleoside-diphosphate-sugar epimerase